MKLKSLLEKRLKILRGFPGSLAVKTPQSSARGVGSIPGRGTKIPHEARHGKERKKGGQGKPQ